MYSELEYRNKVTMLSWILAVGVVFRHGVNIIGYSLSGGLLWFERFIGHATDVIVPLFFIISGYLFFQNYDERYLLLKGKSRLYSVAIPYLIWNVIAYLYYQVIALFPEVSDSLSRKVEPLSAIWIVKNALFGFHNITWFLRYLILYHFSFSALFPLLKNKIICIIFVCICFFISIHSGVEEAFQNVFRYATFYGIGAYLGIFERDIVKRRSCRKTRGACLIIAVTMIIIEMAFSFPAFVYIPYRYAQCILVWIISDEIPVDVEPKWYMKNSFLIYCMHSIILESIQKVTYILFDHNSIVALIDSIASPAATIIIISIFTFYFRKNRKIYCILAGGRT